MCRQVLLYRHGQEATVLQKRRFQIKMHLLFWLVFVVYIGLWLFVWQMSVRYEAMYTIVISNTL